MGNIKGVWGSIWKLYYHDASIGNTDLSDIREVLVWTYKGIDEVMCIYEYGSSSAGSIIVYWDGSAKNTLSWTGSISDYALNDVVFSVTSDDNAHTIKVEYIGNINYRLLDIWVR